MYPPILIQSLDSEFAENDKKEFQKAAESIAIPYRAFQNIESTENGYYVIAGTFSKSKKFKITSKETK